MAGLPDQTRPDTNQGENAVGYDINNKMIFITGANRGIGKAIAEEFIKQGVAKVYAAVRNVESVAPLVALYGDKVVPIKVDVADEETIIEAANAAQDVDVVINNAGVLSMSSVFDEGAMEALAFELDVNLFGLMRVARAFAPVLKANGGGAFVQLNSVGSLKTVPNIATYCTSKAACYAITQALREALVEQGTHVVSVHAGPINTEMLNDTGYGEIAEPPSLVANGIIEALKKGEFHVFPDSLARQVGSVYEGFAENVIMASVTED